ncbi:MAG: ABC transporter permease [Marinoscillum sp.]
MIRNYFTVAFRNLRKQKFYSAINILGLSIGLTCFLFIALFVKDEFSYDQQSDKAAQIYRMDFSGTINGNEFITALMSAPAAKTMKADYPEVTDAFRFRTSGNWFVKRKDEELTFKEENVVFADENFFEFWDYQLISGDPKTCLSRPNSLVMDQTTAKKIFGSDDPIGQTVILDNEKDYEVTGVYADFPDNNHFHFNVMLTMHDREEANQNFWMSFNFNTYLKLKADATPHELEAKFPELIESKLGPEIKQFMNMSLDEFSNSGNFAGMYLFPLKDIHLHSDKLGDLEANGDIKYVYIFSAIGVFILLLACINFMNLATARSANRAKEVGIRKVMGAFRGQLIRQFISEAMLISFISTILAFGLAASLLYYFNDLAGKSLEISQLFASDFILTMVSVMIVVGLLSGSYPAFYLSKFRPAETLKGKINLGFKSGRIRSILVVLQFTVSIVMIVGTSIVFNQLSFIQNKKLGFNKDQIIMINDAWILRDKVQPFKNEALRDSRVKGATVASFLPVGTSSNNNVYYTGKNVNTSETHILNNHYIDHDYLTTLGMEMKEGRAFSKDFPADSTTVILNETAARQMGIGIGDYVSNHGGDQDSLYGISYKIIGIVNDFHYESLRENINPLIFHLGKRNGYVALKVEAGETKSTIEYLEQLWGDFAPGQPFSYSFMDERFDRIYANEQKIGQIFGVFAFLAIFIACLGLFGLASFTAEQKRKEIGIRKVLGASVAHLVNKLSLSFIKLVFVAFVIATPLAYFAMKAWLDDFVYRTDIKLWIFISAGLAACVIAWLTMGFQSWKAARANPVTSLRNE